MSCYRLDLPKEMHACMFYRLQDAHRDSRKGWRSLVIRNSSRTGPAAANSFGLTATAQKTPRSEEAESTMATATGGEEDGGRSPYLLRHCLGLLRGFEEDFKEKTLA
jgi:hypothetical protein